MPLDMFGQAPLAVNAYLWSVILAVEPSYATFYDGKRPFFPISDSNSGKAQWDDKTYIVYDRMFTYKNDPAYWTKKEQILYSIKGEAVSILQWGAAIQTILDRGDDAAKDINAWIRDNGGSDKYPVYYHSLKVYQTAPKTATSTENQRDTGARARATSDFIVEMIYHPTKSLEEYF